MRAGGWQGAKEVAKISDAPLIYVAEFVRFDGVALKREGGDRQQVDRNTEMEWVLKFRVLHVWVLQTGWQKMKGGVKSTLK